MIRVKGLFTDFTFGVNGINRKPFLIRICLDVSKNMLFVRAKLFYDHTTVCPRSLAPFYTVTCHLKWAKTSWTYSVPLLFDMSPLPWFSNTRRRPDSALRPWTLNTSLWARSFFLEPFLLCGSGSPRRNRIAEFRVRHLWAAIFFTDDSDPEIISGDSHY